jgi:hypothetical protein
MFGREWGWLCYGVFFIYFIVRWYFDLRMCVCCCLFFVFVCIGFVYLNVGILEGFGYKIWLFLFILLWINIWVCFLGEWLFCVWLGGGWCFMVLV